MNQPTSAVTRAADGGGRDRRQPAGPSVASQTNGALHARGRGGDAPRARRGARLRHVGAAAAVRRPRRRGSGAGRTRDGRSDARIADARISASRDSARRGADRHAGLSARSTLARIGAEPREHGLARGAQRLGDAAALARHGLELGRAGGIERRVQARDRQRRHHVALVPLEHPRQARDLRGVQADAGEVRERVGLRVAIRLLARRVRIGHEHEAVEPLQHGAPRQPVVGLPGHGVEVKARVKAVHLAQIHGAGSRRTACARDRSRSRPAVRDAPAAAGRAASGDWWSCPRGRGPRRRS